MLAGARVFPASAPGSAQRRLLILEPVLEVAQPAAEAPTALNPKIGWATSLGQALSLSTAPDPAEVQAGGAQLAGWRLTAVVSRTPAQMQAALIRARQWDAALALSAAHSLSEEPIYRARWASQSVSFASVSSNLGAVTDRRWVVEQCLQRTADDEASQRAVLQSALEETGRHCALHARGSVAGASNAAAAAVVAEGGAEPVELQEEEALWWQCTRLRVLQHFERLDTLCAMFDG